MKRVGKFFDKRALGNSRPFGTSFWLPSENSMWSYETSKLWYTLSLILIALFFIATNYLFYSNRKHDLFKRRGLILHSLCTFFAFVVVLAALHETSPLFSFLNQHVPCYVRLLLFYFSLPFASVSSLLQRTQILITYFNSQRLTRSDVLNLPKSKQIFFEMIGKLTRNQKQERLSSKLSIIPPAITVSEENQKTKSSSKKDSKRQSEKKVDHLSFFSDSKLIYLRLPLWFSVLIYFVTFCLSVIFLSISPVLSSKIAFSGTLLPIDGDCLGFESLGFCYLIVVLVVLFGIYVGKLVHGIDDSLYIKEEVKYQTIIMYLGLTLHMFVMYVPGLVGIKDSFGGLTFLTIGMVSIQGLRTIFPYYKMKSSLSKTKELKINIESYVETLSNEALYQELVVCIKQEMSMENALFLETCWKLYYQFEFDFKMNGLSVNMLHLDPELKRIQFSNDEFQLALKKLYNKFFKYNSDYMLNINGTHVKQVENALRTKTGGVEILEPIKDEVLKMIFVNTFPRLVKQKEANAKV
jgi:hypothetical protein